MLSTGNSFFYTQKVAYFVFKDSSSPVKASSFNPLSPDLLTLYRRPNPIKIWPAYAVPPTTTLYPRSTYDLWRAGSSPTIFQPVEKLIPLTTTSQSGPDQSPLYFRPTYALPDQGPLIADPSIFPERERAGVGRVSGVNGPLSYINIHTRRPTNPRSFPTNFYGLVGYDREKNYPLLLKSVPIPDQPPLYPRCIPDAPTLKSRSSRPTPVLPADQSPLCTTNPRHIPDVTTLTTLNIGPTPDLYAWFPLPASNE